MKVLGRFEVGLAWRLALAVAVGAAAVGSFAVPGLGIARLVAVLAAVAAIAALWDFLGRTNRAVARFVEAVKFEDFAQRFSLGAGAGFDQLGQALDDAIVSLGRRRAQAADEARFLAAVVDDTPVALLMVSEGDRLTLLNKASREQFGALAPTRLGDLAPLGQEFVAALALPPSGRRLTRIRREGVAERAIIEAARIARLGQDLTIVSVTPVQKMLGRAELAAQGDLVRVLTHEIMNSLTPVTSLARTAADLLGAADLPAAGDLADARDAVVTLARRAEGMHRFVDSYRAFARAPEVQRARFAARPWAEEIARLFAADPLGSGARLTLALAPDIAIDGDRELLAQVCLNLLRNGAAAARGLGRDPALSLGVAPAEGGGLLLTVADNGPGVPPDRRDDIFLPFYTTRADGHGVGLSFVRQVVVGHGGSVAVGEAPGGGAEFRLLLG